mgnify:CR=1 FL=1
MESENPITVTVVTAEFVQAPLAPIILLIRSMLVLLGQTLSPIMQLQQTVTIG